MNANGNTVSAPVAPTLDAKEVARRARVVANEKARKAREDADKLADERRLAAIQALNARLNMKGAKVRARDKAETLTPDAVRAACEAAAAEGTEIRVSITVPASETRDGRRFSFKVGADEETK